MKKVLIVGLGLLGGSLGMALRGKNYQRYGWARRESTRQMALELDAVDLSSENLEELLSTADITILALPIPSIIEFIKRYASCWTKGAIVTDIGSVKLEIMACAKEFLAPRGVTFVGSHPMAGTEKSGIENSFAELYENADAFICRYDGVDDVSIKSIEEIWEAAGCNCVHIDPVEHDNLVAHTSHVPHILASALALSVLSTEDAHELEQRFAGCATGFRDTSRIASSNPVMWREILEHNQGAVLEAMESFDQFYEEFRSIMKERRFDDFEKLFGRGRTLRDSWLVYKERNKR